MCFPICGLIVFNGIALLIYGVFFTPFFLNARHSGTGRDGIPYCAYEHTDDRSSPVFENAFYWIADGFAMNGDFNDTF